MYTFFKNMNNNFSLKFFLIIYVLTSYVFEFFRLAPGLRGLGYGMITIPAVMNFYYTLIMAYSGRGDN